MLRINKDLLFRNVCGSVVRGETYNCLVTEEIGWILDTNPPTTYLWYPTIMETITIHTAGKSCGNPGPAGVGVLVLDSAGTELVKHTALIGNAEDNFAAYQAVVEAFEVVQEKFQDKTADMEFELQLTNEFVKKQINGEEAVTDARCVSHFIHTHNLRVQHYPNLMLTQVKPEANKAMQLVEELLDGQ